MIRSPRSLAMIISVIQTACVLSIEPVVPPSEAAFDAGLLGSWEEIDGSDRALVSRGINSYTIDYTDGHGRTGRFEARLGRLGTHQVLDAQPSPREGNSSEPEAGAMVPGHLLFDIQIRGDTVHVANLEPDSLRAAMRRGDVRLPHTEGDDRLILTATTNQLRSALRAYIARPGALAAPSAWRRARGPAAAPEPSRPAASAPLPCFEAAGWPEADLLFHRDPHWLGADGASSVDLGGGRTLWLFGDTWIDPSGAGTRRGARMVANTVAIQSGSDPARATVTFYWGRAADGGPAAFVADRGRERLWFGNAARVGDRLVLFLNRIRSTNSGLGFESAGWTAVLVENPDAEPSAWRLTPLEAPTNPLGVIVGYAAVLRLGDTLYAFGSEDPVKSHPIYAARWPADEVRAGNLRHPQWWAGASLGWVPDSSAAPRWPIFESGSSDLTVHFDEVASRFVVVQSVGFGPADVAMRAAPALTGPWTAPQIVYRPPEYARPHVMIYSAKAHPQLGGADLVLTYATNTFQFSEHLTDSLIYYPRFVRLTRCRPP